MQFIKVRKNGVGKTECRSVVLAHWSEGTIKKIQIQRRNGTTKHGKQKFMKISSSI